MRYQLQSLKKAGKESPCCYSGQTVAAASKRKIIFFLDPNVSKKEVHKQSLQKVTSLNKALEGWMTKWEVAKLEGADPAQPDFEALADLAVQGLPERDHENQAWKSKNVKQHYFTKKLHKERIDENTSVLETKQHCEGLENQAFQQVESALAVQSDRTHIVLGSKAARNGLQVEEKEDDTWELYKKAYSSLKKAVQSLSATAEKVAAVKQSLASASEEVQQDPQHQTSLVALGSLQGKASQEREQWQQTLQGFQASLDKASEAEVEKLGRMCKMQSRSVTDRRKSCRRSLALTSSGQKTKACSSRRKTA